MIEKTSSTLNTASGHGRSLNEEEARYLVEEIKSHLESARALLLKLFEGMGWLALGYDSWRQCVLSEFGRSESQLYRELSAARIEAMTALPIGSVPESHIRAVREIYKDEAETARVLEMAWVGWPTTAKEIQSYAAQLWVCENMWGTKIYTRMLEGEIGTIAAFRLGSLYVDSDEQMREVVDACSDPEVARRLALIYEHKPDMMVEVISSASIPLYESVPLVEASPRDLDAWIGIDNAERRAMYVESNTDYYQQTRTLTNKALSIALELAEIAKAFKELKAIAEKLQEALDELNKIKELHNDSNRQN